MPPENLADVFVLYSELLQSQKPDQKYVDANIKTALCKYVLPALGYEVNRDNYLEIMKLVTIDQLKDLRSVQESYFSESKTKGQQRRTYRSHLNKLLEWCNSQRWWDNTLMGVLFSQYCPKYSPRKSPQKRGNLPHVRYKPLKDTTHYCLKDNQLSPILITEFESLNSFLTDPIERYRKDVPIRQITAKQIIRRLRNIFGWLHNIKGVPIESLSLKTLEDLDLTYGFIVWLNKRGVSPKTELLHVCAVVSLLKFLYRKESKAKKYRDIPLIEELREEIEKINKRAAETPDIVDPKKKEVTWAEFDAVVKRLLLECAPCNQHGTRRSNTAIAYSYQLYLIAAFLRYMPPDRSRTIQEYELGRTIFKDGDTWYSKLEPDDYKTGKTYGTIIQKIPEHLYPVLEEYINNWRPFLTQKHNRLFTRQNGNPFDESSLGAMFRRVMWRLTGKACNIHLIRHIAVSHFFEQGKSDAEMRSFALGLKHSPEQQRKTYDKRTNQQKVQLASDMMLEDAGIQPKPQQKNNPSFLKKNSTPPLPSRVIKPSEKKRKKEAEEKRKKKKSA